MTKKTRAILGVVGLFAFAAACSSQQLVQKAVGCSDPCCAGNAAQLDCGESQNLSCVASGDPCTALTYGCVNGMFFQRAQSALPATCAADGGGDAAGDLDGATGLFGSDDGSDDAEAVALPDATADGTAAGEDGAAVDGAPVDAETGVVADAQPVSDAGALLECGDASCSAVTQYCRHTVGGAYPGVDTHTCQPIAEGDAICAPDAAAQACQCSTDAGGLEVVCDVP